jgi:very-short-patch-repair endonuclease
MHSDGWKTSRISTESIHRAAEGAIGRWAKGALDRVIVAIAQRQHGVIALWQLVSIGLSKSAVRERISAGRLHRIHRGVYAVGRPDITIKGRWMAAVLACGDGALLSHQSAATLHELLDARAGRIHVTVPRRRPVARPGISAHRSTCLAPQDRAEVDGIPCTTVPATLLALASTASRNVLESACSRAEIEGVLNFLAIDELLERRRGGPGASRLRAALQVDGQGLDRTKSRLEERFLRLACVTGLPAPAVNAWIPIPGEEMQCDFVWHRERLVVEVDGWAAHRTRKAFRGDRRRDRLLRLHDWDILRITGDDLESDADGVVGTVRAILDRQRAAQAAARA